MAIYIYTKNGIVTNKVNHEDNVPPKFTDDGEEVSLSDGTEQVGESCTYSANKLILEQILALEETQPRTIREALLGGTFAISKLTDLDKQISDLRKQLIK